MWAEPETGGEDYIPLAHSKRARSLDIWAETGKRLGAAYANGGVVQYATPNNYTTVNSGLSEVILSNATLVVKDASGGLIGRMQLEADQRIQIADSNNSRSLRRGKQI